MQNRLRLRNPESLGDLAALFDDATPAWRHSRRLRMIAAMLGYASWPELLGDSREGPFAEFDEALPGDAARQQRWLAMAENLARAAGLLLPQALYLVRRVRPSSARAGAPASWQEPNAVFDEALLKDPDVWQIADADRRHCFAPPGFAIASAVNVAALAARRRNAAAPEAPRLAVLHPLEEGVSVAFACARRADLLEIEPVPAGSVISSGPVARIEAAPYLDEFFAGAFPHADARQRTELLHHWHNAYSHLRSLAAQDGKGGGGWDHVTVGFRQRHGLSWHWPLSIIGGSAEAVERAHRHAVEVDQRIRSRYGADPGCIGDE